MIVTGHLILRPWRQEDLEPFAALNTDPRVMRYFPAVKSMQESEQEYNLITARFEKYGWGYWAVSVIDGPSFIGFVGLRYIDFSASFTPTVEIGWRLAYDFWNKGYATEGAKACLQYGFETLQLNEIVSFTAVPNIPSQRVMQKIGMHHNPKDDFDHPKLTPGDWLSRHVLYRLACTEWQERSLK